MKKKKDFTKFPLISACPECYPTVVNKLWQWQNINLTNQLQKITDHKYFEKMLAILSSQLNKQHLFPACFLCKYLTFQDTRNNKTFSEFLKMLSLLHHSVSLTSGMQSSWVTTLTISSSGRSELHLISVYTFFPSVQAASNSTRVM